MSSSTVSSRGIPFVAAALTGLSSLVFEVAWQRFLSVILGSDSLSASLTLSVFFVSLALGYQFFGRYSLRFSPKRLLQITGGLELLIAVWALPLILFFEFFSEAEQTLGWSATLGFSFLMISLPSFCMGGSVPLLAQLFEYHEGDPKRKQARLYGLNILGALVGGALASLWFLPMLGARSTLFLGSALSFTTAFLLFLVVRQGSKKEAPRQRLPVDSGVVVHPIWLVSSVAAGAVSIGLQTFLFRVVGLSVGSSYFAFPLVVASFMVSMALGVLLFATRADEERWLRWMILLAPISLLGLFFLIHFFPYLFHLVRIQFGSGGQEFSWYLAAIFATLTAFLLIPISTISSLTPLFVRVAARQSRNAIGAVSGRLYGWNTAGSAIGALGIGYLMFHQFDLFEVSVFSTVVLALTACVVLSKLNRVKLGVAVFLLSFTILLQPNYSENFSIGLFVQQEEHPESWQGRGAFRQALTEGGELLFYDDTPDSTVAVVEFSSESEQPSRTFFVNGKSDGNTVGDRSTMRLVGLLGALFSPPETERIGVVGFGTGMTVGALLDTTQEVQIDLYEIEAASRDYAPFFDEASSGAHQSRQVEWIIGDAYRTLRESPHRYGALVSQPSNPWFGGVERLYTEEFYRLAASRLHRDGVFVHWFHEQGLSLRSLSLILSTLYSVFPEVHLLRNNREILVVAFPRPRNLDWTKLLSVANSPSFLNEIQAVGVSSLEGLLVRELWLPKERIVSKQTQRLAKPELALSATRDYFLQNDYRLENTLVEKESWHFELRVSHERTLLAEYLSQRRLTSPLNQLIVDSCGSAEIVLREPEWRWQRSPCRDLTVLYLKENRRGSSLERSAEFQWWDAMTSSSAVVPPVQTVQEALQEIALYLQFDSVFLPLSPQRLRARIAPCFEESSPQAFECRTLFIKALLHSGREARAKGELSVLMQEVPSDSELRRLQELLS